ncbi:MAG: hypothetical protein JWP12_3567 [Bacteroidetes bacterium]|nr:hypothetical protein [Bacteroidota bacterium]
MALYNLSKTTEIYPWEQDQVNYLTKKWKISSHDLNEAILETGSINREVIKKYLVQKGAILSLRKLWKFIKLHYFPGWKQKNVLSDVGY